MTHTRRTTEPLRPSHEFGILSARAISYPFRVANALLRGFVRLLAIRLALAIENQPFFSGLRNVFFTRCQRQVAALLRGDDGIGESPGLRIRRVERGPEPGDLSTAQLGCPLGQTDG